MSHYRIESLLSARQFVHPQVVGDRLYFISDLSGRLSLYVMDVRGSVPEPLLPPDVALPNPHHLQGGVTFQVLPKLGKILLMLDHDGDENYQPVFLPMDGGRPEPVFGDRFAGQQVFCTFCDAERLLALFTTDPRNSPIFTTLRADLATLETVDLGSSIYANAPVGHNADLTTVVLADQYTFGDTALYLWREGEGERRLLFGKPIDQRAPGEQTPPNGIGIAYPLEHGVFCTSALFDDSYGLAYFPFADPNALQPVVIHGLAHSGIGELVNLTWRGGNRYTVEYNIDGSSWVYEGLFDEAGRSFAVQRVLVGQGELSGGVLESLDYDEGSGRYSFAFSTAMSPAQLYVLEADGALQRVTNERLLGIPPTAMAPGEDYPYTSHDGLRISSRLYLPAAELGFEGPRPVIFYIHGGPQSQERPDFTWFSMPLIQFFTLNGFAVWTPNVRGSTGYGMKYMKRIDHDWGGLDRLDHVTAYELLRQDARLDMGRVGVMGRSYGGYMTLTLLGRHPELWQAGVDMFGPYNLTTFINRLPETWRTYFYQAVGHPEKDAEFLAERSPSTYLSNLACPLLVMQGAHDPRVIERESRDVVEQMQAQGKAVDYVVYTDEGHDVLKYVNKVDCYNRIVDFFAQHLRP
ncbi:MAG TPA: prolyl oligopeptidase family serine peptidase [Anaerolineae bacterium]|nr:prolyl oligopeptidase family serine peptidase [Anaerolineae bacterium]HNU02626.1 prolyl oligopeptidase family serine peptidase [Anaerolineae bacterium]